MKLVEVNEVEEQGIENKRKIREVVKYLVQQKGFMTEHNSRKREKDLVNIKKVVVRFEGRMNIEVR